MREGVSVGRQGERGRVDCELAETGHQQTPSGACSWWALIGISTTHDIHVCAQCTDLDWNVLEISYLRCPCVCVCVCM